LGGKVGGKARSPLSFASGIVGRVTGQQEAAPAQEVPSVAEGEAVASVAETALAAPALPPSRAQQLATLVTRVAASPRALRLRVRAHAATRHDQRPLVARPALTPLPPQVLAWRGGVQPDEALAAPEAPADEAPPERGAPRVGVAASSTPVVDIRRYLRPTSSAELATVRKMASLSAFAYFIPSVTVRRRAPAARRVFRQGSVNMSPWEKRLGAHAAPLRARRSARWPRATA
jgi:hypothetical protein